jgi:hypothetical protein
MAGTSEERKIRLSIVIYVDFANKQIARRVTQSITVGSDDIGLSVDSLTFVIDSYINEIVEIPTWISNYKLPSSVPLPKPVKKKQKPYQAQVRQSFRQSMRSVNRNR